MPLQEIVTTILDSFKKVRYKALILLYVSTFGNPFWITEMNSLDWRFMARGEMPADPRIVLLDIDDEAKNLFGPPPWKLTELEKLLRPILASRPAAIGLDLRFYGYTSDYEVAFQQFIANIAQDSIPIVLAVALTTKNDLLKPATPNLPSPVRFGSVTLIDPLYPESDDVVRRTLLLTGGDQPVYSFSLQLLAAAKRMAPEQCFAELAAAGLTGAATDYHVINYYNNYRHSIQQHLPPGERFIDTTFTFFRAGELLEQWQSPVGLRPTGQAQIDQAIQDSTIVLVGATYDDPTSDDWFRTPLSWKETISGVVVHANILNWLLRRSFISEPDTLLTFFMTLGLIILSWLVIHFMEFKKAVLLLVSIFLMYGLATFLLFASWEIWLPLIWPLRLAVYFVLALVVLEQIVAKHYPWRKEKLQWLMPYASLSFSGRRKRK